MSITSVGDPRRAVRGGSWANVAQVACTACRSARGPSLRCGFLGLRLARRCS